ncbi:hypothetical protein [Rossellomorea marisflavi]|uniref:hypothetical protein n=1 Tax=Rossellomorea marisflavi TaxID=189381 RepID=UPI003D2ED00A
MSVNKLLRDGLWNLKNEEGVLLARIESCTRHIERSKYRIEDAEEKLKEFRNAQGKSENESHVLRLINEEIQHIEGCISEYRDDIQAEERVIATRTERIEEVRRKAREIEAALDANENKDKDSGSENGIAFIDPSQISTKVWTSLEKPNAMKISTGKIDTGCITNLGSFDATAKITNVDIKPVHFVKSDRLTSLGVALDKTMRKMQRAMGIKR